VPPDNQLPFPLPLLSFIHVRSVLYSNPHASATSNANRIWALVVHSQRIAFLSAI
jgi:hypothetical protein